MAVRVDLLVVFSSSQQSMTGHGQTKRPCSLVNQIRPTLLRCCCTCFYCSTTPPSINNTITSKSGTVGFALGRECAPSLQYLACKLNLGRLCLHMLNSPLGKARSSIEFNATSTLESRARFESSGVNEFAQRPPSHSTLSEAQNKSLRC